MTTPDLALPATTSFVEPTRHVPIKWLSYELRYVATIALLALGFVVLTIVALPTNPADASDRALRTSVLVLPLVGAFASAIVIPGRGERRVLYGAAAMAAGIPFLIMIAMPAPTKLDTVVIFSLTAGFLVWAWLIVRDRRRVLHLLALGAFVTCFAVAGVLTEVLGGSGTLTVGWSMLFTPGTHVVLLADLVLARQNAVIWFTQAVMAVTTVVAFAWSARLLAPRMRYISPAERDAVAAATLARKQAVQFVRNPDAAPLPPVNTLAILSLVFGILGGWLAIVFGFIALKQVKRTGERGRGLAIAGIITGFAWVVPIAAFFILGFAGVWNR